MTFTRRTNRDLQGALASLLMLVTPAVLIAQQPADILVQVLGTAFDSIAMRPLGGARIRVVNAADPVRVRQAIADSAGLFRVDSLEGGRWFATMMSPTLDSLDVEATIARIDVQEAGVLAITLTTPSARTLIVNRCGTIADDLGLFYGTVRSATDESPLAQARLVAEWPEWVIPRKGRGLVAERKRVEARADSAGRFAMCGVPAGTMVRLSVSHGADSSGVLAVELPPSGFARRDVTLGRVAWVTEVRVDSSAGRSVDTVRVRRGGASARGRVADVNGRAVAGAMVRVLGSGREGRVDSEGTYTVRDAAAGTQTIEARAIGFQPVRQLVELRDGVTTPVSFTLAPQLVNLDTVRVVAGRSVDPAVGDFERRWRRGGVGGTFMDGETLRRRSVVFVTDALRAINGVRVIPVGGYGQRIVMRGMAGRECVPIMYIDGIPMHTLGGGMAEMFIDDFVSSSDIAAMEVYPRSALVPAQFADMNGCGTVAIWTHGRFGGVEPREPSRQPKR
ncbi:MAG TPA: carboxypeptidase regulatory-like domain-containing protein [Gemmatimonadaceae bacterium]|nr:carboxypeptidase regulatory-like domain-containing protein [Gemmatimonadaceae bacterium]